MSVHKYADTGGVVIDSLGGYRLVRKLGEGPRAEVFLAHPHRVAADAIPAAIKIFRDDVINRSITLEIEALSRSTGAHSVELLDLTTAPNGAPALILARCATGSVGRLIRVRSELRPGEAITIIAPIASTLERLHDAGVAHGAIRPDAVLFDAAGTPTLGCFGSARLLSRGMPVAAREAEPALSADLRAMKQLAMIVLGRVRDDATVVVLEWLGRSEPTDTGWLETLSEKLFRLGEPLAVDLQTEHTVSDPLLPSRLLSAEPVSSAPEHAIFTGLAVPAVIAGLLPQKLVEGGVIAQLRGVFSSVRPRFWVVGAAVVAALLLALVLVPHGQSAAVPPVALPTSSSSSDAPAHSAIGGDDPAAAAVELLAARESCVLRRSVLCLDGVVQPDSAAAAADRVLIRDIQDGQELPAPWKIAAGQVTVHERLGDTSIVSLGDVADDEPASLLLMKSETGWRIRDYLRQ